MQMRFCLYSLTNKRDLREGLLLELRPMVSHLGLTQYGASVIYPTYCLYLAFIARVRYSSQPGQDLVYMNIVARVLLWRWQLAMKWTKWNIWPIQLWVSEDSCSKVSDSLSLSWKFHLYKSYRPSFTIHKSLLYITLGSYHIFITYWGMRY